MWKEKQCKWKPYYSQEQELFFSDTTNLKQTHLPELLTSPLLLIPSLPVIEQYSAMLNLFDWFSPHLTCRRTYTGT